MRLFWFLLLACAAAALPLSDAAAQRAGGRARSGGGEQRSKPEKFASAPKDPQGWVGMKVMPRTPTATVALQDKPTGHASDVSPWPQIVRKVNGAWLWIEAPGACGWINVQDVVPLADAILYFNEGLARRMSTWDLYMRGSTLRDYERFAETYKDFKALEKLEEKELAVLSKQATAQQKKKDYHALIATTTRMARLSPGNVTIYTTRGAAYLMLKEIARAKADFDHAVELAASTASYSARATFYREQGDLRRAIEDLDKAIYHWPLIRLHEERAKCLILQGDYTRAIEDLNVALAHNPAKVENYLLRARAQLASGQTYEGNLDFSAAIQLAPRAETYQEAATARYLCGDYRRAIDDASMAIRLNPRLSVPYLMRGDSYVKLNRYDEARADLDRAIQLNPRESQAFVQRGQLAFKIKNPDLALSDGIEAYRLGNRSTACLLLTGLGYIAHGNGKRCIEIMNEALRADPAYSQAYSLRSVAAWVMGDDAQAKADAIEAKLHETSDPSATVTLTLPTDIHATPPVDSRMAIFLTDIGMPERALAVATAVIAKSPDQGGGYYARGLARVRLRDYDGARVDLQAAIERDPADAEAYRQLTNCNLNQDRDGPLVVDATHLMALDGPSFFAFMARAWGWHGLHELERVIEDIADALTYRADAEPKKLAECYLLRSEAHKRLGQQALCDADRQLAAEVAHGVLLAWDEMMRKEDQRHTPSLFVHAADGENLRSGATKSVDSSKEKKKPEPWEEDFSLRSKEEGAGKKWPKLGTPSAFR